ncbi:transmembrane protein, putative [Medicago truncatula]|uniref:Transmembrane protein, putative n=1 Tax=Medicago truncatula TaxID=3880 RepID=G7JGR2_MEDTR|nr:transmembrane protein, putative [Medicago truncatula]
MHIKENEICGPKYMQMLEFEPQTPHLFTLKILIFIMLLHSLLKLYVNVILLV